MPLGGGIAAPAGSDFNQFLAGVQARRDRARHPPGDDRGRFPTDRVSAAGRRTRPQAARAQDDLRRIFSEGRHTRSGSTRRARSSPRIGVCCSRSGSATAFSRGLSSRLWGVESNFGRMMGTFNVPAALATLAYEGRRGAMFRAELLAALKILDQGNVAPEQMVGSWAGAMGQCQFMPTTYLTYAVDFNGDGRRDIWNSTPDVLGSIGQLRVAARVARRRKLGAGGRRARRFRPATGRARHQPTGIRMGPARGSPGGGDRLFRRRAGGFAGPCRTGPAAPRCSSTTISAPSRSGTTRIISPPRSAISPTASAAANPGAGVPMGADAGIRKIVVIVAIGLSLAACAGSSGPHESPRRAATADRAAITRSARRIRSTASGTIRGSITTTTRPAPPRGTARRSTGDRPRTARFSI